MLASWHVVLQTTYQTQIADQRIQQVIGDNETIVSTAHADVDVRNVEVACSRADEDGVIASVTTNKKLFIQGNDCCVINPSRTDQRSNAVRAGYGCESQCATKFETIES